MIKTHLAKVMSCGGFFLTLGAVNIIVWRAWPNDVALLGTGLSFMFASLVFIAGRALFALCELND